MEIRGTGLADVVRNVVETIRPGPSPAEKKRAAARKRAGEQHAGAWVSGIRRGNEIEIALTAEAIIDMVAAAPAEELKQLIPELRTWLRSVGGRVPIESKAELHLFESGSTPAGHVVWVEEAWAERLVAARLAERVDL